MKGDFSHHFYNSQPITRERFDELAVLHLENTGKVAGAFEIDLDAGWLSGLRIMDGWQTSGQSLPAIWRGNKSSRRVLPLLKSGACVPWRREIYSVLTDLFTQAGS